MVHKQVTHVIATSCALTTQTSSHTLAYVPKALFVKALPVYNTEAEKIEEVSVEHYKTDMDYLEPVRTEKY